MIPTKEQERKALEQIKKILAGLGDEPRNSYVLMAFRGCVEDAEENIENDFGLSWKDRAEKARKEAEDYKEQASRLAEELEKKDAELAKLQRKTFDAAEIQAIADILKREQNAQTETARVKAEDIVAYAEKPESPEFIQAVEQNRRAARRADMARELINHINDKFYS